MKDILKYTIKLHTSSEGLIRRSNGSYGNQYDKDFYINLPVYKTIDVEEYVDVSIDPYRFTVDRQFINPFFIELGIFKNATSLKEENGRFNQSIEEKVERSGLRINK